MGNSTDGVARLMEAWLSRVYPALEVIRVHSLSNLFRYDENIAFVNHELLPKIEAMRTSSPCSTPLGGANCCGLLSASLCVPRLSPPPHHHASRGVEARRDASPRAASQDGATARISAIHQSLSRYRPNVLHAWQLKT